MTKTLPGPADELKAEKDKASGNYRLQSVIDQLKADFLNKCYLCELKAPTSINIEHRIPHQNKSRDLEFDWSNLFWACSHCNGTKGDGYQPMLDCTAGGLEILSRLEFSFDPFPKPQLEVTALDDSAEAVNTAALLNDIHKGTKTALIRQVEAANLCDAILTDYNKFLSLLERYQAAEGEAKDDLRRRIRKALSKEVSFTAVKACFVRRNPRLYEEFCDLVVGL